MYNYEVVLCFCLRTRYCTALPLLMAVAETAQPMFARHQHGSWNITRSNASAYPFIVASFVMIGTSNSVILAFEDFQSVFEPDCNHQQGDLRVSLFCSRTWYC